MSFYSVVQEILEHDMVDLCGPLFVCFGNMLLRELKSTHEAFVHINCWFPIGCDFVLKGY